MQIKKKCKPESAMSSKRTRFATNVAMLTQDGGKPALVATDGKIMAIIHVELDPGDTDGPISAEALKAARKASKDNWEACVLANGALQVSGTTFTRPTLEPGAFPRWEAVVGPEVRPHPTATFGVNAHLLAALQDALGADALKIHFYSPKEPLHVEGGAGRGAIMPVTLE